MELQEIRDNVEKFVRAMDEEHYLNLAGLKEEMNTAAIFQKYGKVFDPEIMASIAAMKKSADAEEKRRLGYLHYVLAGGYLEHQVKDLSDKKNTLESRLKVKVKGEDVPFRLAAVLMVNEDDRKKRTEIDTARNKALDSINPILVERMDELHALAKKLGYDNYALMYSRIKNIDFKKLMDLLESLIKQTNKLYQDKLGALTETIGLKLEEAEKHDISYLFRAKQFDKYFEKDKAIPALKKTLKGLGIVLDDQKNVIVDAEERPKKSPRAFCAALEVPDKIMLVIMPKGGYGDYDTLFHEAGHAEHYAHVPKRQDMEYKYLGDNSVTETHAFTLQYLNTNEAWIKRFTTMDPEMVAEYLDFVYTEKLFFVRRYAAKLKYELKLHTKGIKGMDGVYKDTLESVLRFRHPTNHYLTDLDDGLYCAQYLRAWLFEAQLERELRSKFGDEWFLSKGAGDYIKSLWQHGQKYNVEELAKNIGYEPGSRELIEDLKSHLS
jgi:oligoendopeptidase F